MCPDCDECKNQNSVSCNFCSAYEGYKFELEPNKKKISLGFNTHKDKLYEFTTWDYERPTEIRTKGQWKKYMKSRGLHDDIKQGRRNEGDYVKINDKPIPAKEHARIMNETSQKLGIRNRIMPELRRALR